MPEPEILKIFISPGHNFFGHYGKPPGTHPSVSVESVECVAGKGLAGDRFFDFKPEKFPDGYDGQITFFAWETYRDLCEGLHVQDRGPEVFRRNILVRGVELMKWVGTDFDLQGVTFHGVKEAAPCEWMEKAFAPGALKALKGRGGLRARIVTSGTLSVGPL